MFDVYLLCAQCSLEYLTLNNYRQIIQSHRSMLELLFWVYCFSTIAWYFSTCDKQISFEEQHVYSSFLSLIFATSYKQIWVVHLFYCFPWSSISFPCLYLDNNWISAFFIVCSAKNLLGFMGKSISCFKLLSTSLGKWKWITCPL